MGNRGTGQNFATRSEVIACHGMAATSQPLATTVAIDILKQGGSAVDAAIAANAMLGLVEPTGCGIGGDLFAMVWDVQTQRLHGLNASGRSPKSLSLKHLIELVGDKIPSFGPLSISVPGAVDGWFELHNRFGQLPFDRLLAPTIAYANEGFPVSEVIADAWASDANLLNKFPGFSNTFLPSGEPPKKGAIFKNLALAKTLNVISSSGRDAFYDGDIANVIEHSVKEAGGFLSSEDLRAHTSEWVQPVSTSYRGVDIWELPPNGQGIAALQMLNILEGFDIESMGVGTHRYIHHLVEAKKIAYEDRAKFYADPAYYDIPVAQLISKEYAAERRKLIKPTQALVEIGSGDHILSVGDTVYLTTADNSGNIVSLIQSNFRGMGSGLCPKGLGFGLQDRGELFSLDENHANCYAPGKRPFHTIIPAFATLNGKPYLSFGVMGGDVQPQMHVQIIINLVDFKMNIQEAGDAPRVLHSGSSQPTGSLMQNGGAIHLEDAFSQQTRTHLTNMGHCIEQQIGGFGGYQAIRVDSNGTLYGASESRKDGHAAGY